jgi:hypothetical protein
MVLFKKDAEKMICLVDRGRKMKIVLMLSQCSKGMLKKIVYGV